MHEKQKRAPSGLQEARMSAPVPGDEGLKTRCMTC